MRRVHLLCAALLAATFGVVLMAAPAHAQATRTWVSGVGDDANPCSRTAPCKTFAGAISKTAARGEISVLDPGGFGAVTITKSISIVNDYSGEAGILASGTNGVVINAAATDIVILRGLVIDGGTAAIPGVNGIRFLAGNSLHVEKCLIKNFTASSAGNGNGILFAPSSGVPELYVMDTSFVNNGTAANGSGIQIQPTGSASVFATLSNVHVENSRIGVQVNSTTTTGAVTAAITNSTASGSTGAGYSAVASGNAAVMTIGNSVVAGNANGLVANGSGATIRIGSSIVTGNGTATGAFSSGSVLSYKNNFVDGNTNNTTPIPAAALN